jgi:RND superfamily putative drug exporter
MFDHLGKFVTRYWAWVLIAWIVGVGAIKFYAPDWSSISQDDDVSSFPPHFDSRVALELRKKAFPEDAFNSEVVIVVERRDAELSELDFQFIDTLATRLTQVQRGGELRDADGKLVQDAFGLHEFLTHATPDKGPLLKSKDGHASLLLAGCDHTFMAEKVMKTVAALRTEIATMKGNGEIPAGLEVALTGSAGVGADVQFATNESLERSKWTTLALVLIILLFVYRSPIVAMNPLATIGVSVVTAMSLMAIFTLVPWMHFQVMKITEIFVFVVLFGAGTDYCLFLIARYREEQEKGEDRETALRLAIHHVGGALAASAATVVVGLGMMVFADFGKFRYTGPAVAISLVVALVGALTLTPALLRLVGPLAFWPFAIRRVAGAGDEESPRETGKLALPRQMWESFSHWLVRRPTTIWATSVVVMLPFAIWGFRLTPTYDFLSELDDKTESKVGSVLLQRDDHFPKGTLGSLTLLLQAPGDQPKDFSTAESRKDIAELTRRLQYGGDDEGEYYAAELIAQVRSLTSPLGDPLDLRLVESVEKKPDAPPEKPKGAFGQFWRDFEKTQNRALETAQKAQLQKAKQHYVSEAEDGRVTRLDIVFNVPPFSKESMKLRDDIERVVRDFTAEPDTVLTGASHSFAGITATTYDLEKITQSDQKRINRLVVIAVYVILVLLLRRPWVCIYLMVTVLFGYYATLGMTEGAFRLLHEWHHPDAIWLGLDWKVSFFLFIILVAVGEDYNILLMARVVEEERKLGVTEGVRTAVARTGGIITSCGIIMAGTFGSMATGTLAAIIQLGFALALGVILDTFVVRPILVPTFLLMIYQWQQKFRRTPAVPAPHTAVDSKLPAENEPVSVAHRRGLLALLVAWFGRGV